jgi:hypothetical protein
MYSFLLLAGPAACMLFTKLPVPDVSKLPIMLGPLDPSPLGPGDKL